MGSRPLGAVREKAKDDSEARYINCTLDSTKGSMNTQPPSEHQNAINEFLSYRQAAD